MAQNLNGKTAAVTGAASGIGLATTKMLLNNGVTVVMVDSNEEALERLVSELPGKAIPVAVDLLDPEQCEKLVPTILEKVEKIDIFHCNAGVYIGGDLSETTPQSIDRMLNLNINVVMKNIHAVAPHMKQHGGGDIVVTCSMAAHFPVDWEPVYSSSKWAVNCFVQTMRRQLIPDGIRVAQVSPGPVISALLADWPEENLRKAKEAGSLLDASEISDAIEYILTRDKNVTIRDMLILPTSFDRL
ncbi:SDR family oxidoreductase [Carnimonas nigrificans]|uniref:SDR family oxidoreductase n=1 Tax=Carnimonas nigrificans TaxID=64323 RepID=UPI000471837B|nr:SDR family oxidoreductase [Carnimonas nigrificans]